MGQKVNPISLRLGINKTWDSRWYSEKDYGTYSHQEKSLSIHDQHAVYV